VWEVVGAASRDAIAEAGITAESIAAIAVSAMRFSTVVITRSGDSLLATGASRWTTRNRLTSARGATERLPPLRG